jgi:hypothetical protein
VLQSPRNRRKEKGLGRGAGKRGKGAYLKLSTTDISISQQAFVKQKEVTRRSGESWYPLAGHHSGLRRSPV